MEEDASPPDVQIFDENNNPVDPSSIQMENPDGSLSPCTLQ